MPNRIIKESICRSESIDSLSWFQEVLFYRLMVACDDYGRFDGRIPIIKGTCFPLKDLRNEDIMKALQSLSDAGMVEMYEVQGKPYLHLTAWEHHQQTRAAKSKYPAPENKNNNMISNDINGKQIQSNVPVIEFDIRNRNRNRETPPISPISSLDEFLKVYPCHGNRHLTEIAYIDCLMTKQVTEEQLVIAAKNYAQRCQIMGTEEQYIKRPENFLRDLEYCQYMPGIYVAPEKPQKGNSGKGFNDFALQQNYDFTELETELREN